MILAMGGLIQIEEMVVPPRRADEQRPALPVGERRAQHLGPGGRRHRGIFIENQEVQSVAAEGIVVVGATQRDRAAGTPRLHLARLYIIERRNHRSICSPNSQTPCPA